MKAHLAGLRDGIAAALRAAYQLVRHEPPQYHELMAQIGATNATTQETLSRAVSLSTDMAERAGIGIPDELKRLSEQI